MKNMKRSIVLVVAIALLLGCAIGGTLAWLMDSTAPVVNTFTVGNIDITLVESGTSTGTLDDSTTPVEKKDFKMVPGTTLIKDPTVTVKAGSEACYLFVQIDKSASLDSFITWAVVSDWIQLPENTNVYYREVAASDEDQAFAVLAGNNVTVKSTVTKAMMDNLLEEAAVQPTLTFKAYAVQKDNIDDVADAWKYASTAAYNTNNANTTNGSYDTAQNQ